MATPFIRSELPQLVRRDLVYRILFTVLTPERFIQILRIEYIVSLTD